jgi:hypothetical protein
MAPKPRPDTELFGGYAKQSMRRGAVLILPQTYLLDPLDPRPSPPNTVTALVATEPSKPEEMSVLC